MTWRAPSISPWDGEAIRVKGRNTTETEHVKLGAYHTLDLDVNRSIKLVGPNRYRPPRH
jgi:stalled ribosome rescue protein Dom34